MRKRVIEYLNGGGKVAIVLLIFLLIALWMLTRPTIDDGERPEVAMPDRWPEVVVDSNSVWFTHNQLLDSTKAYGSLYGLHDERGKK